MKYDECETRLLTEVIKYGYEMHGESCKWDISAIAKTKDMAQGDCFGAFDRLCSKGVVEYADDGATIVPGKRIEEAIASLDVRVNYLTEWTGWWFSSRVLTAVTVVLISVGALSQCIEMAMKAKVLLSPAETTETGNETAKQRI